MVSRISRSTISLNSRNLELSWYTTPIISFVKGGVGSSRSPGGIKLLGSTLGTTVLLWPVGRSKLITWSPSRVPSISLVLVKGWVCCLGCCLSKIFFQILYACFMCRNLIFNHLPPKFLLVLAVVDTFFQSVPCLSASSCKHHLHHLCHHHPQYMD